MLVFSFLFILFLLNPWNEFQLCKICRFYGTLLFNTLFFCITSFFLRKISIPLICVKGTFSIKLFLHTPPLQGTPLFRGELLVLNQSLSEKSRTRFDELSVLKFLDFHFLQF